MLAALGRFAVRRRFLVIAAWSVLVALGLFSAGEVFDRMTSVADAPAGSESLLTEAELDDLDPEGEIVTAVIAGEDFFAPVLRDSASAAMAEIRAVPGVAEVTDAYTSGGLIGDDGRSSLVVVELDRGLGEEESLSAAAAVSALLHGIEAPEVLVGGELLAEQAFVDRALTGAAVGEGLAILVLLVVLVMVLGGFRAGLLPIAVSLATIVASLLALAALVQVMPVNEFAINIVTILGLGLAVDYSLLMLFRFREERAAAPDDDLAEQLARTVRSSGRAVLVSGAAVFIALIGLLLLGEPLLSGMALGGAVVVLLATLAGLTLVPAAIALVHRHLPEPGVRTWSRPWGGRSRASVGLLGRSAALAGRRPVGVLVGAAALLGALSAPVASLALDSSDIRSLPAGTEERVSYERAASGFAGLGVEPVTVLIEGDFDDPAVRGLLDTIAALDGVADADLVPDLPNSVTAVDVTPTGDSATGEAARRLVGDIRALDTELTLQVAGPAAALVDTQAHLAQRIPLAIGVVVLASFALLFALTRSVVVPLKALAMSTLTMTATLGVLVMVFQWGWGAALLGFEPIGTLDVTTPLLIGLLAFGLTMDYQVFLLARIHERWSARDPQADPRRANAEAVQFGITRTGPVVTTAAAAIGIVFLGFAIGELVAMKEIGIGMLVAVLLDVTLVRGFFLPAAMTLLGRWNWWPSGSAPRRPGPEAEVERPERRVPELV
ncbi:MMPL family transporter [Agromyces seonyuensis]|uniref:MMPL family transporter n=1 Tax=Agromyces seonyuensis TaxID=2662446 RepID=A0A6I4P0I2_9MICO|nr:MMPL family transporter [Agromyces seonyuensis]MWC00109.1 MMPL family transporter [Agromyces seonyuensis]